jgi:hypothetical protein
MLVAVRRGPTNLVMLSGDVGDRDKAARREIGNCVAYEGRLTAGHYSPLATTAAL